jgi:hypothetical protein
MTVQPSDLQPGATVATDRYVKTSAPFTAAYERDFNGVQLTASGVPFTLETALMLARTSAAAQQAITLERRLFGSPLGRSLIAASVHSNLPKRIPPKDVHVGKITSLGVGSGSFEMPVTIRVPPIAINSEWAVVHTGPVAANIVVVAVDSKLPGSIVTTLGGDIVSHVASVLAGATGPSGPSGPTGATGTTGASGAA